MAKHFREAQCQHTRKRCNEIGWAEYDKNYGRLGGSLQTEYCYMYEETGTGLQLLRDASYDVWCRHNAHSVITRRFTEAES